METDASDLIHILGVPRNAMPRRRVFVFKSKQRWKQATQPMGKELGLDIPVIAAVSRMSG
jgi:hypothetical protein